MNVWIAQFFHGNYGDFNATHYSRVFNNYFTARDWLNEHSQHWNTCHRVTGARQCSVTGDYTSFGTTEHIN
jgi:hypothetical protein